MKLSPVFTFLLLNATIGIFAQAPEVLEYKTISVNGITWESTKNDLIKQFAEPDSIYDPKFDCGFYSTNHQDIESVLCYHYTNIDFLIVDNRVVFKNIYFDENNTIQLRTPSLTLNFKTTTDELKKYFPNSYKHWLTIDNGILRLWPCENCDDEIWLHIEDGHITRIQFWDPC